MTAFGLGFIIITATMLTGIIPVYSRHYDYYAGTNKDAHVLAGPFMYSGIWLSAVGVLYFIIQACK